MTTGTGPVSDRITVRDHAISVDGKRAALYGGAMHYWRLDRDKWSEILDHVKEMGFTTISIYIPWEVHEVERGTFDFTGNKDVDAFLTLIEEKDLSIVVRPGPQINSELTGFGYPLRILADPEIQALNSQGTPAVLTQVPRPIPAVSYAVDKFFEEAALWYDAICPILARHAYPNGRVLAAQVDNEMAFFFHVNAYASDYHPSAIERYRAFLGQKYGAVEALNTAYGTSCSSFESIEPPRRWEATDKADIPWYTDWIEYRERYLIDSLARLADMMRARGLGSIPLFHNYPHPLAPGGAVSGYTTPFNLMGLEEKLDFVGFDVYSRKELYEHIRTVLSYVVGTSRFPYIPEFIAGVWPWYLNPGDLGDEEFVTKAGIMQGIKGFSRYMLVERDRWLDSPIRRDGRVREDHAAMFARMNQVLACERMTEARRQADVLLLANRDYDRLEAASVLVSFPGDFLETPSGFSEYPTFMTTAEDSLGFGEPIQQAKAAWFANAYDGLKDSGFAFLLSDTALSADQWSRFKAVVVSSFDYMSADVQRRILDFAESGGTVVLGPRLPVLDERMQPNTTLRDGLSGASAPLVAGATNVGIVHNVGAGRAIVVTDFSAPADVLRAALQSLDLVSFERSDARLDVAIHRAGTEPRAVVFVCNPTADRINARVALSFRVRSAREVWEDRDAGVVDGSLVEALEPYTIKIYECAL